MKIKIYKHTSPSGKSYVGITNKSMLQRWKEHVKNVYTYNSASKFANAVRKYGKDRFTHEILEVVENDQESLFKESMYIAIFNSFHNGYNGNEGGLGRVGPWDEATKNKISKSNTGKVRTPEAIEKMRKAKTGVAVHSDKHKQELSEWFSKIENNPTKGKFGKDNPNYGQKRSKEFCENSRKNRLGMKFNKIWRENISKSLIGSQRNAKRYELTFPDHHTEIITNMAKFCRENGLHKWNMSWLASGKIKSHQGFTCKILS